MVDLLVENCSAGLDARQLSSENENERVWGIFMRDQGSLMSQEKGGSEAVGGKKILSFVAPQGGMFSTSFPFPSLLLTLDPRTLTNESRTNVN